MVANLQQDGAAVARLAHNQKVEGSNPSPAKYQRVGKSMISPLNMNGRAFDIAVENYAKYSGLNFWDDLMYYLRTGYVICQPTLFAMFRPIERDGKRGWFVQMAVGEIGALMQYVPCELEFIAFCRNGDENMRVIEWQHFVKKVGERYGWRQQ